MIRLILIIIFLILFFTVGQLSLLIGFILSIFDKELEYKFYKRIINIVFDVILFISGVNVEVIGKENIETYLNNGVSKLLISNHRSFFDIIAGYGIYRDKVCYMSKDELKKFFLLKIWMDKINCIFIDRKNIKEAMKSIIVAIKNIQNGISVWIFPEGTRNKNENQLDLLEFKEGSFSIAKKTGCEIVPIAFLNTDDVFEKHFPIIKKTKVKVIIGKSFFVKDLDSEYTDRVSVYAMNEIKKLMKLGINK